ncbi:MAG: acetate--CoA ligase [Candidatus Nanopelagicales bacterium]|nr:acetate--CoA ligase [Candidatus Nanopelagicales bacterium]
MINRLSWLHVRVYTGDMGGFEELPVIRKDPADLTVEPNLRDYAATCREFTWDAAAQWLDGLPDGGMNIAYEAVDRHVVHGRGDHVALRCLTKTGGEVDVTYAELAASTNAFANALRSLGISPGERVFSLVGRVPALYTAVLGTLKARSVFAPLFSAFGPEPIRQRVVIGGGVAMLTTKALYRKKIAVVRDEMPTLRHVILADEPDDEDVTDIPGAIYFDDLVAGQSRDFTIEPTDPEDTSLLHFTSGTTGTPKAAVHVHGAVVAHYATGHFALDLHPEDVYWCTADPGWVTGTSYGFISPLTHGLTMIVDEGEFDARRWYETLSQQRVSVWYTAPTAIRMLMRAGAEVAADYDLSSVRFVASVGEPLNPEAVVWGREALGLTIHDNWWQTETGGIMIANFAACDVHPGSMGRPMPGITAGVLQRGEEGRAAPGPDGHVVELGPDEIGELALRVGWPSMFRGYLNEQQRYEKCFADGWYLTGDLARCDENGYFWFVGRADDVIKTAGHLIGPFEVESVLMEHPAVAEAGVIGVPDPVMGEKIKAFVSLKPGVDADPAKLRRELTAHARRRLGPAVAPREIEFADNLPKTRSGKIMRRLLKARELGLPEGDLSTLESSGGGS